MQNKIKVTAQIYTTEGIYNTLSYEVEFWHQAMAVLFFKYKDKPGELPYDKTTITNIEFKFDHG